MGLRFIGSHINYDAYRETDLDELHAIAAEVDAYLDTMPRPQDDWGRQNDEATARQVREALAAAERGEQVYLGRDDDGYWFAVGAPDEYADAPVLSEQHDDDCLGYRHAHVIDAGWTCDCGTEALVGGEINEFGSAFATGEAQIRYSPAGEWHARCPFCGVVYVLTPAPVNVE